jgi:hypothetical protein
MNDVVMKDVMVTSHHAARALWPGEDPGGFFRLFLDLRDGILECSVKKLNEGPDHGGANAPIGTNCRHNALKQILHKLVSKWNNLMEKIERKSR